MPTFLLIPNHAKSWVWDDKGADRLQMIFLRLMLAVLKNTFEHADPLGGVVLQLQTAGSLLQIKICNLPHPYSKTGNRGTRRVMEYCLKELNGKLLKFPEECDTKECVTAFSLPLDSLFR